LECGGLTPLGRSFSQGCVKPQHSKSARTNDAVVLAVMAGPKPHEVLAVLHGERPVVNPNPNRPEAPDLLEMQGRMPRVAFQNAGTIDPLTAEFQARVARRTARTCRRQNASQLLAASLAQVAQRFVGPLVQPAGAHVLCQLLVPRFGVEVGKPRAERGKLLARQLAHRQLNFLNRNELKEVYLL